MLRAGYESDRNQIVVGDLMTGTQTYIAQVLFIYCVVVVVCLYICLFVCSVVYYLCGCSLVMPAIQFQFYFLFVIYLPITYFSFHRL